MQLTGERGLSRFFVLVFSMSMNYSVNGGANMKKKIISEVVPYIICMLPVGTGIVLIGGVWRWILCIALLVMMIAAVCSAAKIFREYTPPKDLQNAEDAAWFSANQDSAVFHKVHRMGMILDGISLLLTLGTMLLWDKWIPWVFLCVLCFAASVFLAIRYPAYVSLLEDDKSRRERCGPSAVFLILPVWLPVNVAAISFFMRYSLGSFYQFLLTAAGIAAVTGILLWLTVPELRERKQNILAAFLLAVFVSFGLTVSLNYLLDFDPAQVQTAVVAQKNKGAGKSGPSMTVIFSDGNEQNIPIVYDQYYGYEVGDGIRVECHGGGLGIEYFHIP